MKKTEFSNRQAQRVALSAVFVAAALVAARWLWVIYEEDPWTRDGRVRIDVAEVSPDVSGLVTRVDVKDNMRVHRGQTLFTIDQARYQLALQQADAVLQEATAGVQRAAAALHQTQAGLLNSRAGVRAQEELLAEAQREDARNHKLGSLVPEETLQQGASRVEQVRSGLSQSQANEGQSEAGIAQAQAALEVARATLSEAVAKRDTAKLNLQRTDIVAPVDGVAANVQIRPGNFLNAGHAAFGIADESSLHVDGYFEETKLRNIRVGDSAVIRLMGDTREFTGYVESIAPGIVDRERAQGGELLANVNPTFNWVRLAQRIPVRIHIDHPPEGLLLIAGRTASVALKTGKAPTQSMARASEGARQ